MFGNRTAKGSLEGRLDDFRVEQLARELTEANERIDRLERRLKGEERRNTGYPCFLSLQPYPGLEKKVDLIGQHLGISFQYKEASPSDWEIRKRKKECKS